MKAFFDILFWVLKWIILLLFGLELFSFVVIGISNYLMYGHFREGSVVQYDAHSLFTDMEGVRPTVHCGERTEPAFSIWMFGGSTMRGQTDDDSRTIPSQLACMLNQGSSYYYEVTNFGVNSYNSLLEVQRLQRLLIEEEKKPDLIIFYDGANDCMYFSQHRTPYAHYGYRRQKALIESYYKSFFGVFKSLNAMVYSSYTKELYDKLVHVSVKMKPDDPQVVQMLKIVPERYDYVNKVAHCYGAGFVVFWQPSLWVDKSIASTKAVGEKEKTFFPFQDAAGTLRNNFSIVYEGLEDKLKDKDYFVDFKNILQSRSQMAYTKDGVHLTDYGRKLVAIGMARDLAERDLLP